MVWGKLLAKLNAASARSEESGVTVLSQRPEPEPPAVGTQRRLRPLFVVWVETSEVLEAPPRMVVESTQSITVEGRRNSSDGENHFAEGRPVAEELQGNLGVGELAKGIQNATSLSNATLSVLVAELPAAHGPAKQLEVAVEQARERRQTRGPGEGRSGSRRRGRPGVLLTAG